MAFVLVAVSAVMAVSFKDGVYIGKAEDMQGSCAVEITMKSNTISRIALKEGRSDIDLTDDQLRGWLGAILKTQDLNAVDAVSGATMSCDLLKKAIFDALTQAKE